MAKTYLSAVKYNIVAEFEIDGIVDKPDIIGAVFGQSEGLLGQEMDLKQLQQNGKIGRIEIDTKIVNGKTLGTIMVPSSMDMVQTSLLAAAIESVDKVGPCEARIQTKKIEDTRNQKRKEISSRAQELLQKFMQEEIPESREMADELLKSVQVAKLAKFGPEKLPAGPDIEESDEIIVVEGRADVLNLLKHGVTNVIAMDGSKVPASIIKLSKDKTIVAFVDGDRGGELNARHLQEVAKLEFVVRAPDGKEVEELTKKEIVMALRKKIVPEEAFERKTFEREPTEFTPRFPKRFERHEGPPLRPGMRGGMMSGRSGLPSRNRFSDQNVRMGSRGPRFGPRMDAPREMREFQPREMHEFKEPASEPETPLSPSERQQLEPIMKTVAGTLKAKLLDAQLQELSETSVRELVSKIQETPNVHTIVFDGIITKRLADEAEKLGVKRLVGIKKGWFKTAGTIQLATLVPTA